MRKSEFLEEFEKEYNNIQNKKNIINANEYGYYELVMYLEEHRKEYVRFILTGEQ